MEKRSVLIGARGSNRKVGDAYTTYTCHSTCPKSCPLYGAGCYAEGGFTRAPWFKLVNRRILGYVATEECQKVEALPKEVPVRLHVAGDVGSAQHAAMLGVVAQNRTGRLWTYTHRWREILREAWGNISVLASCEKPKELAEARLMGYAPQLLVKEAKPEYENKVVEGFTVVICGSVFGMHCTECRYCWDDWGMFKYKRVLVMEAHGNRKKAAAAEGVDLSLY